MSLVMTDIGTAVGIGALVGGAIAGLPFERTGFGTVELVLCMLSKLMLVAVFVPILRCRQRGGKAQSMALDSGLAGDRNVAVCDDPDADSAERHCYERGVVSGRRDFVQHRAGCGQQRHFEKGKFGIKECAGTDRSVQVKISAKKSRSKSQLLLRLLLVL